MDITEAAMSMAMKDIRGSLGMSAEKHKESPQIPYYHEIQDNGTTGGVVVRKPLIYTSTTESATNFDKKASIKVIPEIRVQETVQKDTKKHLVPIGFEDLDSQLLQAQTPSGSTMAKALVSSRHSQLARNHLQTPSNNQMASRRRTT